MIKTLPVMLLKNLVILPNQEVKVELNNTLTKDVIILSGKSFASEVLIVSPKDSLEELPDVSDLPKIGVIGYIKSKLELPNGQLRVTIIGKERVKVKKYFNEENEDILKCYIEPVKLPNIDMASQMAIEKKLTFLLKKYIKYNSSVSNEILGNIEKKSLDELTDLIASFLPLKSFTKKLNYMEEINPLVRGKSLIEDLNIELEVIKIDQELTTSLQKSLDKSQREFILREKKKQIDEELGEALLTNLEASEWLEKLKTLNLDSKTTRKIEREIAKYEKMNEMSPDASFVRNYLDTFFHLPWNNFTQDETDLTKISLLLNKTHYGLDEVKNRLIEYMAIKKRNPSLRSPIICLVGPPGVGKTSIALSIANALGKEFYKISLGGLNDATELSGHRRTYIGSSPGKLIEAILKCGTKNPVLLLDEVDKMTKDYKGDPASVLLDALDYPQNQTFVDNYIEEPFDLSNVIFILTANDINKIPVELRDRLETIELNSYTLYEKITLARDYLLPQIYEEYNLSNEELTIPDGIISSVITHYTKEAGVRDLKRKLEMLVRKIITSSIKAHRKLQMIVEEKDLKKYLDVYQYDENNLSKTNAYGLVNALAWTSMGGMVLPIESCSFEGDGKLTMTGSLEKIIKESVLVAIDYIKSHAKDLEINDYYFRTKDIHLHALDGATKKDGPSAGIAMVTSLLSLFKNHYVDREVAMTGEITLRGDILAVGGIKEKLIGAFNTGIKTVYIPKFNKKDLKKVPDYVKDNMNIILVSNYKEVYKSIFETK